MGAADYAGGKWVLFASRRCGLGTDGSRCIVLLRRARRAATFFDVALKKREKLLLLLRMVSLQVVLLGQIIRQIVKLNRWKSLQFFWRSRRAPAAGAGTDFKLPLALADRE